MRKSSLLVWIVTCCLALEGAQPCGLLGGDTQPGDDVLLYGAQLLPNSLMVQPLTPLTVGEISSVAINDSGVGIIGGYTGSPSNKYAALVLSNGALSPLTLSAEGQIESVAINNGGFAIIGGFAENSFFSFTPYAVLVSPNGSLNPLDLSSVSSTITIMSVAINDGGKSFIGGFGSAGLYLASVSLDGTVSSISGLPASGSIRDVAINSSGSGLVGGVDATGGAYAAFISTSNSLSQLSSLPSDGRISAVAINKGGTGLIGGYSTSTVPYAALVSSPSNTVNPFSNLPSTGQISSVAINDAGAGLIGGHIGEAAPFTPYAALVFPNSNTVTPLADLLEEGQIFSVAINHAGVGLIGGQDQLDDDAIPYAALVAPNGTVTPLLNLPDQRQILSVAINSVAPTSISSYLNPIQPQLAAAHALETRFTGRLSFNQAKQKSDDPLSLLVCADEVTGVGAEKEGQPSSPSLIWFAPFGSYVDQRSQGGNPSSNNTIGGFLLGYDYSWPQLLLGGALGYAYNYTHYGSSVGHGTANEELVSLYGAYQWTHCRIDWAAWGGYYQLHNERHTATFSLTSSSSTTGWLATPHLEIAFPYTIGQNEKWFIEPFALSDWVNNWQKGFTERGDSGFNLVMKDQYTSLLRSEAGLRFYQSILSNSGRWLIKEQGSYVNQTPFHAGPVTTTFVSSPSSFSIAIGNDQMVNLGGAEVQISFIPTQPRYPYLTLDLQGEWGSSYQSYFACLELGAPF